MLYKVGECIFLLSFCQFKWLSGGALFWTCFHLPRLWNCSLFVRPSPKHENSNSPLKHRPLESATRRTLIISVLRYSSLTLISAVLFTVFLFTPSAPWPWHGWLTDRTSETCKYLKDFSEISPCHIDFCIKLEKKRWMSTGWCCHRTAMCTVCAHSIKITSFSLWSDDCEMTSKTQYSNEMQSNWSQYECNIC